jgi:hypothetical protein
LNDRTSVDLGISMNVPAEDGKLRFWRNTVVANQTAGQVATLGQFIVGYETDEDIDNSFRPAGLIGMSATTFSTSSHLLDQNAIIEGPGTSTHKITLYRAASGALVFGAGTIQWSWGLDGTHNNTATTPNASMRQATVNLFADMGVEPWTLQSGLVAAVASTDHTAPSSAITSPTAGSAFTLGTAVTITGTASDLGGGLVGGVEVSVDGGATWHPATGRGTWTYSWVPATVGTVVIKSRAADDSGNIGAPSAGVSVTVAAGNTLVAAFGFDAGTGTTAVDASGRGNTGTISGAAWTTSGKYGSALSFDGINDLVTVADANSLDLTSGMTLEAWIFPTAINGWETVILKEASNDLAYALYGDNNGNDAGGPRRPVVSIRQGSTTYWTSGTAQVALNQWTHIAATYDGAILRFYVNGTLASSQTRTGSMNVSSNPLRMGGNNIWGEWFNGRIDEVRIYSRALSAAELQTDMNTPVTAGSPQLAAEGAVSGGAVSLLTNAELAPIAAEATRRWAVELSTDQVSLLSRVQFWITDLNASDELGETLIGSPYVMLDDDGAGRGWFVDPTPADDTEFVLSIAPAELRSPGGPADGRYDLLTVVMHELGHVLGLDDLNPAAAPHDLLTATLPTATRRVPAPGTPITSAGPVISTGLDGPSAIPEAEPAPPDETTGAAPPIVPDRITWLGPTAGTLSVASDLPTTTQFRVELHSSPNSAVPVERRSLVQLNATSEVIWLLEEGQPGPAMSELLDGIRVD